VKTEADDNDITECSYDDKPTVGMFGFSVFSAVVCCVCLFVAYLFFIFVRSYRSNWVKTRAVELTH